MKYSVYLRPFIITDTEKINKWRNDEEIQRMTCGRYRLVSKEIEKNWVQSKITNNSTEEYFAICLNDGSDEMIGYFSIREIDLYNRKCHFAGIVIDPEYQGGMYMIDTKLIALEYAFLHLGMNRITGKCLEDHTVSRVMMEMFGFELEGIERQSIYKYHRYHNVCTYSILFSDYQRLVENGDYSVSAIAKKAKKLKSKFTSSR